MDASPKPVHIWQDNETDRDLLGFDVHADLIRSVITDPTILPVTVGVFGDWGGGKSSIMKMLQKALSNEELYPTVVCLYFNGWTFEGYEDAKSALLSSILVQLGEHKRFGPKVKDWVVKLLRRVKWMELGKLTVKHVGIPLGVAVATGGMGALPAVAASVAGAAVKGALGKEEKSGAETSSENIDWRALIEAEEDKPDLMGVRKFRDEFEKMLEKTDISVLVVLIDDLDRCLPERLIETLEAIKLFVSVPRTAFVIGADPRMVRHAISTRYVKRQLERSGETPPKARSEEEDLIQDYLEKLIQVPYQLPRLSPSEIETYVNLLACEKFLEAQKFQSVLGAWRGTRAQNVYAPYATNEIQAALSAGELSPALQEQLDWSKAVASVLTEGLKGNPRQVKRMLNALSLRKQLAAVAKISIKEEVLAKLMVLEYSNLDLFQELNQWQAGEKGVPSNLKKLEELALEDGDAILMSPLEERLSKWKTPSSVSWLRMRPPLSGEDLRDYFWLARDRTGSTLSGITMTPPRVQAVFRKLLSENAGESASGLRTSLSMQPQELQILLDLLRKEAENHPDRPPAVAALHKLAIQKVPGAALQLFEVARRVPAASLLPSVPQNIAEVAQVERQFHSDAVDLLKEIAKHRTRSGKAAQKALETLERRP